MVIGKRLQKRRKELNLSRAQLAEMVHVTASAIANYENSISYPKPDILISLILALKIDANYLFEDYLKDQMVLTTYGQELSAEEKDAITKYRELSNKGKRFVRTVIDEEYDRMKHEEWVVFPCYQPGERNGDAAFLMTPHPDVFRVRRENIVDGMEYCFQIQTDRYEPVFKKNDVIALAQQPVGENEIGIFSLNGACYIRLFYRKNVVIRLRALNVMDPDVEVHENDRFECFGKILGKVQGILDS